VILTAVAAIVGLAIPELRAVGAQADRRQQLLRRLEVPGHGNALPRVRDVGLDELRVHAARVAIPYIERDMQDAVDGAVIAGRPLLIVGHSMAGKTRLAAQRVGALLPDAKLLAPRSSATLRELVVDAGLDLANVVVWLDDLERFLRGESALDGGLLDQIREAGGVVVATMRLIELEFYRPRNSTRPPESEVLRRFERVTLQRKTTPTELRQIRAAISDPALLAGVERYGLAEYVGAGPDAVEKFDNGETTCPVGHALVRAAVDWRRAGLARVVPFRELEVALTYYLYDRPDVISDDPAIQAALEWATERINETVALLVPHQVPTDDEDRKRTQMYEAFDYLVDVVNSRPDARIPIQVWQRVASAAGADTGYVANAADRYFIGRSAVIAEVASWLALPATDPPQLLVLTGSPGSGKSALLAQLNLLADLRKRTTDHDVRQMRLNLPSIDIIRNLRDFGAAGLLEELCRATAQPVPDASSQDELLHIVLRGLAKRQRPFVALLDALDEAPAYDELAQVIRRLTRYAQGLPLRLVVSTRRLLLPQLAEGLVLDLDEPSYQLADDLFEFARSRLLAPDSPYRDEPALVEEVAATLSHRSNGNVVYLTVLLDDLVRREFVVDPSTLPTGGSISEAVGSLLLRLGPDEAEATTLLATLAHGPPAGFTVAEWVAAASERGNRRFRAEDLRRLLPMLAPILHSDELSPHGESPRYRFFHAGVREYFFH
jgi:energy-coupling factor transporter ATP-binding protein EcfA2